MATLRSSLGEAARANIPVRLSGFVVGALMPFALYFSTRSTTLFVGIAAALAAWGLHRAGLLRQMAEPLRRAPGLPLMFAAAFMLYAALSLFWSAAPGDALFAYGELTVALSVSIALGLAYNVLLPYRFGFGIAVALVVASVFVVIELKLGLALRGMLGIRSVPFVFNRSVVYLALLVWPMLLLIEQRSLWLAVLGVAAVVFAALTSESGAAVLGLFCGAAACLLATFASRLTPVVLAVGAVVAVAAAPFAAQIARFLLPAAMMDRMQGAHVLERLDIWTAYSQFLQGRLWLGTGFGTSAGAPEHPSAQLVDAPLRSWLEVNHPHNAFLQVWVELGAVGAALFALFAGTLLLAVCKLPRRQRIFACGLSAASLAVMAASHGAWQAWWITGVSALAAVFWAAREPEHVELRR